MAIRCFVEAAGTAQVLERKVSLSSPEEEGCRFHGRRRNARLVFLSSVQRVEGRLKGRSAVFRSCKFINHLHVNSTVEVLPLHGLFFWLEFVVFPRKAQIATLNDIVCLHCVGVALEHLSQEAASGLPSAAEKPRGAADSL